MTGRAGSGLVRACWKYHGSGRVGSGRVRRFSKFSRVGFIRVGSGGFRNLTVGSGRVGSGRAV